MTVNTAEDLLLVDNVQAVTLTLKRAAGDVTVTIDHANGGQLQKSQEEGIEGNVYPWTIPDVELNPASNGYEIRPDDVLNDGIHNYVVLTASQGACGGKWNATTVRDRE